MPNPRPARSSNRHVPARPWHDVSLNMTPQETESSEFNRRDFLKGGSVATLMTMLGGVPLFGQTNQAPAGETKPPPPKTKVAVIGLGAWGREIVNTLGRLDVADVVAICDTYPSAL